MTYRQTTDRPPITFQSKQALLDALEARRPFLQSLDDEAMAQHTQDEKDYLVKFKSACREAAKWNYQQASAANWEVTTGRSFRYGAPSCPRSWVARLDRMIGIIAQSSQQKYTINATGVWSLVHELLAYDPTIVEAMC